MDRNSFNPQQWHLAQVALRKESVDRNVFGFGAKLVHSVALRKESVDRNEYIQAGTGILNLSLSARRAWIEIYTLFGGY